MIDRNLPAMMPKALRAAVRQGLAEERLTRADILRWIPNMSKNALLEFIDTGRVANDRVLTQLETAWKLFEKGRLTSVQNLKRIDLNPKGPRPGGFGPNSYQHTTPDDPLYDFEHERKLAIKRLRSLSREETNYLRVSQSTIQIIRRGGYPKLHKDTVERILEHERRQKQRSRAIIPRRGYKEVDRWWEGNQEFRKVRRIETKIIKVKRDKRYDAKHQAAQPPEPNPQDSPEQALREQG